MNLNIPGPYQDVLVSLWENTDGFLSLMVDHLLAEKQEKNQERKKLGKTKAGVCVCVLLKINNTYNNKTLLTSDNRQTGSVLQVLSGLKQLKSMQRVSVELHFLTWIAALTL